MTDHTHTQESTPNCHESGTSPQRRLGLIGCPIGHSLSPALFREHFASRPDILEHWSYDLIERSTFDEAWKAFLQNYAAVNVTAPFKENAFRAADSHDYSALRCRASNLLVKTQNEGVKAYNTDFKAVMEILRQELQRTTTANTAEEALEKVGRNKVLVIGCGGAGKAATAAALEAGMQVSLCNRTASRAQEFADYLRRYDPHKCGTVSKILNLNGYASISTFEAANIQWTIPPALKIAIYEADTITLTADTWQIANIKEADIIIYTLPCRSDIFTHLLSSAPDIFSDKIILEANYKDPVLASIPCRRYISGLTWLRLQALATYRIVIGR
ncbi:MAG TPA: hypothetical protein IAB87_05525 [Candidatus Coprenecus merdipullorum]|nr:hypothetical protein [Candidatus Coprenecus merdipullorum]